MRVKIAVNVNNKTNLYILVFTIVTTFFKVNSYGTSLIKTNIISQFHSLLAVVATFEIEHAWLAMVSFKGN